MKTLFFTITLSLLSPVLRAGESGYDPTSISEKFKPEYKDFTIRDEKRSRDLPIRVFLPTTTEKAPVILFSHGLGGGRTMYGYLGERWSARGYIVVHLQHPGSDDSVWKEKGMGERKAAIVAAANAENYLARNKDVPAVLDELERWNADKKHPLYGRLDLKHVGMSGHSFGAKTTQAVSGEAFMGKQPFVDSRILAAIPMSPSPAKKLSPDKSFGEVKIPWMTMTGTKDDSPIGEENYESRSKVYPALPKGDKYNLVLNEAEHSVFGDRELPMKAKKRNPNHHKAILALSTAFWDAYLKDDPAAKKWLAGDAPKQILDKEDIFDRK